MKMYAFGCVLFITLLVSCELEPQDSLAFRPSRDTIAPVIHLRGAEEDTTYLQVSSTTLIANGVSGYTWLPGNSGKEYDDPGVIILDERNGRLSCSDIRPEVTGYVNIRSPGVYYLHYRATDASGNTSTAVTRTVHVLPNNTNALTGIYNVICTCSTLIAGSLKPTVTTHTYITAVSPGAFKNSFDASALKIGPLDVVPSMFLTGNAISVSFYLSLSDFDCNTSTTGTLSAAKNSFTIESTVHKWSPVITYHCVNVYRKSASHKGVSEKPMAMKLNQ